MTPVITYWRDEKLVVEVVAHAGELAHALTSARPMGSCETEHLIVVVHGKPATPQPEHVPAEEL